MEHQQQDGLDPKVVVNSIRGLQDREAILESHQNALRVAPHNWSGQLFHHAHVQVLREQVDTLKQVQAQQLEAQAQVQRKHNKIEHYRALKVSTV